MRLNNNDPRWPAAALAIITLAYTGCGASSSAPPSVDTTKRTEMGVRSDTQISWNDGAHPFDAGPGADKAGPDRGATDGSRIEDLLGTTDQMRADAAANSDAGPRADVAPKPDAPLPPTYSELTDTARWASFNVQSANAQAKGYLGVGFDGRYAYFIPYYNGAAYHGTVARYDTQASFGSADGWTFFNTATANPNAIGYVGGTFDGRYLYLAPHHNGAYHGRVARYDTTAPFASTSSWAFFDISTVTAGAKGYLGAVFDKNYVYFVPYHDGVAHHGRVARYDIHSDFGLAASWKVFDLTTVNPAAKGFYGGGFDGRYLYFVPHHNGAYHGLVARYDTTAGFDSAAAWSTFDMAGAHPNAKGYIGAGFDGRYMYFVPYGAGNALMARYDTSVAFASTASWSFFDVSSVNGNAKGFYGAAFDGRYMYFIPNYNGAAYHGYLARLDTKASFGLAGSWSVFDVATINPGARGSAGAAFDGRYLYLVPHYGGGGSTVLRFDAKSPPSTPSFYSGSFF